MFTLYRGGSVVPTLGLAFDPVNQFSMEPFWALEYVLRDDVIVNLAQRYFVTPRDAASRSSRRGDWAGCLRAGPRRISG